MENLEKKIVELRKITNLPVELVEITVINSLSCEELAPLLKIKKYKRLANDSINLQKSNESFENIVKNFPGLVKEIHICENKNKVSYLKLVNCNKKIIAKLDKNAHYDWFSDLWDISKKKFRSLEKATLPEFIGFGESEYLQNINKIIINLDHDYRDKFTLRYLKSLYKTHQIKNTKIDQFTLTKSSPSSPSSSRSSFSIRSSPRSSTSISKTLSSNSSSISPRSSVSRISSSSSSPRSSVSRTSSSSRF